MRRWLAAACWAASAAVAAWALVRLLGLERGYPVVQLMAFTPYVAAAAVVVVVAELAVRRWWPAALAAVAALGLALSVVPRAVGGGDAAAGGPRVRVMTTNVHFGSVPAEDLVAAVRRERVEVLSVQELTPSMARRLRRAGIGRVLPEAVLEPRPGGAGTGIYARTRLRARRAIEGPLAPQVVVETTAGERRFEVVAVHPPPPTRRRLSLWVRGLRQLPRAGGRLPRILAGDFNATLDHEELRDLLDSGYRDAADRTGAGLRTTWPRGRRWPPEVTIDHVLVDRRWAVRNVAFVDLEGSDHRAVIADLALTR
jgi:endonuclease/exonuclease/phosphatase (EEP) superfamily protein YafD